jgi:hypothetical protein
LRDSGSWSMSKISFLLDILRELKKSSWSSWQSSWSLPDELFATSTSYCKELQFTNSARLFSIVSVLWRTLKWVLQFEITSWEQESWEREGS